MYDVRKFKSFSIFKNRFLSYFPENYQDKEMENRCWNWTGYKNLAGYGRLKYGQQKYLAHRMSYIIFKELIPYNKMVRHTCDNPSCVNPKHLILGNAKDNMQDHLDRHKGNIIKLNSEAVKVIKWILKYQNKRGMAKKLSLLYKVNTSTITLIKKGSIWAHIKV